jgi:sporulation protein YlmC with PRC-barrel domain
MQATKVARGYRASALELKQVVNEKGETVGRLNDFILGKDGNNYVILAVDDFTGLTGELVAVPFKNLKLDDPSGNTVLPRASNSQSHHRKLWYV